MTGIVRTKNFQNWMKCISAQNETRKALCEVVEQTWKGYISCLDEQEREQIETFLKCVKCADIKYLKKDELPFCNHPACALLLKKLLKLSQNTFVPDIDHRFSVPTSDLCYFLYWPIAKLFLFVEEDFVPEAGLNGLDICYLLKMMNGCQLFAFEGSSEAYNSICRDRDELIHTGDCSISDATRQTMEEHMSNVLSHFRKGRLQKCTDVLSNIQQNETNDWLTEYKFEYKHIARQMLELKIAALKNDIIIQKSKPLEDFLNRTETLLHEVNESISMEESGKEHDELVETENCKVQEDKSELLCRNIELLANRSELEKKTSVERFTNKELLENGSELKKKTSVERFSEGISIRECGNEHDKLVEIENRIGKTRFQEDITKLLCRDKQVNVLLKDNEGENGRKIMMVDQKMTMEEKVELVRANTENKQSQEAQANLFERKCNEERKRAERQKKIHEDEMKMMQKEHDVQRRLIDKEIRELTVDDATKEMRNRELMNEWREKTTEKVERRMTDIKTRLKQSMQMMQNYEELLAAMQIEREKAEKRFSTDRADQNKIREETEKQIKEYQEMTKEFQAQSKTPQSQKM